MNYLATWLRLVPAGIAAAFLLLLAPHAVSAQERTYVYDSIDVTIDVHEDSTVDVTERITQRFDGTFRGVRRDIALTDPAALARCQTNPALQCGGFSYMEITGVYDNEGRLISPSRYSVEPIVSGGEQRLEVVWVFSENGRVFEDELFTWTVTYRVYGSLGFFDDYDLLYWDAIFSDRDVNVEDASVTVLFPGDVKLERDDVSVPSQGFDYSFEYVPAESRLRLETGLLRPYEDFTVLVQFPKDIVTPPATLLLNTDPDPIDVSVDGIMLRGISDKLTGLTAGEHTLIFSADGYQSKEVKVNVEAGTSSGPLTVELDRSPLAMLILIALVLCNCLGILILPFGILLLYRQYRASGVDIGRAKVIVPEFAPPEGIRPYLLGSLKDESVDLVDVTATLIDVAYRGYIKIREFEAKTVLGIKLSSREYEFIKQKEFGDLTPVEQKILNGIFSGKDRVTTDTLKNSFYTKLPGIRDAIYAEMVSRDYFPRRPDKVRSRYQTMGGFMIAAGFGMAAVFVFLPVLIGTAVSLGVLGIITLVAAGSMPAKTALGSKVFDKVLGFKMYMETAERFRVQDLTPETFEKYLSYAMVFGIENEWAERFMDIYKEAPEWFEGSSADRMLNTIYIANALSNFNSVAAQSISSSPSSSSSSSGWSGGGWSGGGGFSGGFSGGGGGGGGGGAF